MIPLIQCIPNFSEGIRREAIDTIVASIANSPGVRLVDWSADTDHNRMVVTFLGEPDAVKAAALTACATAIDCIDLRHHAGVHPRLGAVDVLPFVPISSVTMEECAALARDVARELAVQHDLPIFLYAEASPESHSLPQVRKEAFTSIMPDFGPSAPHPTAGASVVGARGPLVAYNVNLTTADVRIAKRIAREIRDHAAAESPAFIAVRALGLFLASRSVAQVSMNITRPAETPLLPIFRYIEKRAVELGTEVLESEVIGALPGYTGFEILRDTIKAPALLPGQVLFENWPE